MLTSYTYVTHLLPTVDQIVLSIGLEVSVEEFFDSHYLVRSMASLLTTTMCLLCTMHLLWPYRALYSLGSQHGLSLRHPCRPHEGSQGTPD